MTPRCARPLSPFSLLLLTLLVVACQTAAPTKAPAPVTEAPAPKPPVTVAARLDDALTPRDAFFGNPERKQALVSPDGKRLAFLAPHQGVLNVWLSRTGKVGDALPITDDKSRGIRSFVFSRDSHFVLFSQDKGGDENWRIYAVNIDSKVTTDLTPIDNVQAQLLGEHQQKPGTIAVLLNDRSPEHHDLYWIDIKTGRRTLKETNTQGFSGYSIDNDLAAKLATLPTADGGYSIHKKDNKNQWVPFFNVANEDGLTTEILGFSSNNRIAYLTSSEGRDTAALYTLDLATGQRQVLAEDRRTDIDDILIHPKTRRVEAIKIDYDLPSWRFLDTSIERDFTEIIKQLGFADVSIQSRSDDDKIWTLMATTDLAPSRFYRYVRHKKQLELLFVSRPALVHAQLSKMHPRLLQSRDGLTLMSYLTLPKASDPDEDGVPTAPVPLVLLVHGGPWGRDRFGYDPIHQWLQSRGYAVLAVNFRGSTGFGKTFSNAGDKEWGQKMHDDLLDAVDWAKAAGIADANKIAIMGGSYGGYATLVGVTRTPDAFACGVDIVGPSNLITLFESVPPYWKPMLDMLAARMGDARTDEGRALLRARSPLFAAANIKAPLLIGQGKNDPRVKQAESDQIVAAMQQRHTPVTYVLYPDEGHGFARPENKKSFFAVTELFLSQCLGGVAQPIGADFTGSSLTVPAGVEMIDGLAPALSAASVASTTNAAPTTNATPTSPTTAPATSTNAAPTVSPASQPTAPATSSPRG